MPVGVAKPGGAAAFAGRRGAIAAAALGLAIVLSVAIMSRPDLTRAVTDGVSAGFSGIKTVAAMLDDRSPGERAEGSLASLKPKKQTSVHERALPKVRGPVAPASPFAALVETPVLPPIVAGPLYPLIAGIPPEVLVPPAGSPGVPGGPVVVADVGGGGGGGGAGGGGGDVIVPPVTTPTETIIPAVPEPSSWAMMLIGFALMAPGLRRGKRGAARTAST